MKSPIIISFLLLFACVITAQKENNIWHFGLKAGLDFNSPSPVAVMGLIDTNEGCASISDSDGQLLFYTDGLVVRDRNHQIMPNSEFLEGGWSSTQSALIVKQPGSLTRYYVFTTSDANTSHLSYSVVDMTLNGGNGDVVTEEKNIPLEPSTGEKIAATYHGNGNDIWIASHRSGNSEFVSFLLSEDGLDTTPVVSTVGSIHEDDKQIGPIRFSHDGTKVVCSAISSLGDPGVCELFDFDNCSGIVSNGIDLNEFIPDTLEVYGIEFSPNDHILYFTCFELFISRYLFQLDLENFNLTLLLQNENSTPYGAMQLGPDQKIYFTQWGGDSLSVIHFPDNAGIACQVEESFLPLVKGTSSSFGLPNPAPVYQSSFNKNLLRSDTSICIGESLIIDVTVPSGCDPGSILWSDGSTGTQLTVSAEGNYGIEVSCSCLIIRDSIQITLIDCPSECLDTIYSFVDTTICNGQIVEGYSSTGVYVDTLITSEGCDSIRTIHLTVLPSVNSSLEENICLGELFEGYTQTGTYIDTFESASGCDSIRTIRLHVLTCESIVHYGLEACNSYMHDGTNMDYSEFVPVYPNDLNCAGVSAGIVFRSPPQENKHSCTPGVNGSIAMCISTYNGCSFEAGHAASLIYEVQVTPQTDSVVRLTSLSFFEKAPDTYSWIDGPSGPNNFPMLFAIRITKNGIEIYREEDIETTNTWTLKNFDFITNDNFLVEETAVFRFELLPYCPVGNGAEVSAWDIDEISLFGGCVPMIQPEPVIKGNVHTKTGGGISMVEMQLSKESFFTNYTIKLTDDEGNYLYDELQLNNSCFLRGYKNDDVLNGVSTIDLLLIRKHLLGLQPFTSLDQYIAADINHNGKISVLDLAELQKLLLGITTTFSNNTSWRFGPVPQDMTGSDMSVFNEISLVESLVHDTLAIDFLGIKIGDISGDVVTLDKEFQIENRTQIAFPFIIDDQNINREQVVSIPVRAGEDAWVEGLQLGINLQNLDLLEIKSSSIQLSAGDYSMMDGILRVSWSSIPEVKLKKDDVLFELVCRSSIRQSLSQAISLSQLALHPELYLADLEIKNIDLIFGDKSVFGKGHSQTLRIEPNPVSTEAHIHFVVDEAGPTQIRLFDSQGKMLYEDEKYLSEGAHEERIAFAKFSAYQGVIYCQVITTTFAATEKFMKL